MRLRKESLKKNRLAGIRTLISAIPQTISKFKWFTGKLRLGISANKLIIGPFVSSLMNKFSQQGMAIFEYISFSLASRGKPIQLFAKLDALMGICPYQCVFKCDEKEHKQQQQTKQTKAKPYILDRTVFGSKMGDTFLGNSRSKSVALVKALI